MPRGFDIANYLCEYNGIDDFKYPNLEIRKTFISCYLGKDCSSEDVKIIDLYAKISHYYWGCWL